MAGFCIAMSGSNRPPNGLSPLDCAGQPFVVQHNLSIGSCS